MTLYQLTGPLIIFELLSLLEKSALVKLKVLTNDTESNISSSDCNIYCLWGGADNTNFLEFLDIYKLLQHTKPS